MKLFFILLVQGCGKQTPLDNNTEVLFNLFSASALPLTGKIVLCQTD